MLIDTHAHLSDPKYDEGEVESIIKRAGQAGVEIIISPASNLEDVKRILLLTNKYSNVYGLAGLYPGEAAKSNDWKSELEKIEEIIKNNQKMIGIGEIGLEPEIMDEEVFEAQLRLAVKLNKPVAIHNRDSHKRIRKVIEKQEKLPRGMFHCFSGDQEFLKWVLAKGFYVGFDGNITYKSNRELRELMKMVPEDRLVLETDSPYLPPEGKRGTRNEPGNVRITAQMIAKERGVDLATLAAQTTKNARELFKI